MARTEGIAQKVITSLIGMGIVALVAMTISNKDSIAEIKTDTKVAIAEIKKETITRQEYANLMTEIAVLKSGMDNVSRAIQDLNKTNQLILQRMSP